MIENRFYPEPDGIEGSRYKYGIFDTCSWIHTYCTEGEGALHEAMDIAAFLRMRSEKWQGSSSMSSYDLTVLQLVNVTLAEYDAAIERLRRQVYDEEEDS